MNSTSNAGSVPNSATSEVTNLFLPHLGAALTLEVDGSRITEKAVSTASFDFQIANFAAVVRGRAASPTPADDAIANMRVIDEIYRGAGLRPRGEATWFP